MAAIRFFLNLALATVAIFIAAALALSFTSEHLFRSAERLAAAYKWHEAEVKFREAIKIDPYNEQYYVGLGEFLMAQARYQGYKDRLFNAAETLFREAIRLDPRSAEPFLQAGLVELSRGSIDTAFDDFRKAVENDPNGFNVAYSVGNAGLSVWGKLGAADKKFTAERLARAIEARPSYADLVYSRAWQASKDAGLLRDITPKRLAAQRQLYNFIVSHNLWQARKAQAQSVARYLQSEDPEAFRSMRSRRAKQIEKIKTGVGQGRQSRIGDSVPEDGWLGRTVDGKNEYKGGIMYWSGTIDAPVLVPEGDAVVRISARGEAAGGCYPYMIVELDGEEIGEALVDSSEWKDYEFRIYTDGGIKALSVAFINDWCDDKEDRNLFVSRAEVAK